MFCGRFVSPCLPPNQGGGRSPAGLTLELCRERGHMGTEITPPTDALCVVVPGAAATWERVVERHGKLSLGRHLIKTPSGPNLKRDF